MALLRRTGVGRDINRHRYGALEVEQALAKPVVRELLALIRLRNTHPAFAGTFSVGQDNHDHRLTLRWSAGAESAELKVDLLAGRHEVSVSGAGG